MDAPPQALAQPLEAWQREADGANPAIRLQALAVQAARAEAERHGRAASPSIDLVAQAGQDRLRGSGDYGSARNGSTQALVGVQLTVPLYTGGWRSAKEEESLRLQDKAQAQEDSLREQVAAQVHAAWLGLSLGAERVQALQQALQASEARLDATHTGREAGDRTLLDWLNAQSDTAAARLALAQARSALLLDGLRLALLAGQQGEDALRQADQMLALP
jgi:outer membrane protein